MKEALLAVSDYMPTCDWAIPKFQAAALYGRTIRELGSARQASASFGEASHKTINSIASFTNHGAMTDRVLQVGHHLPEHCSEA